MQRPARTCEFMQLCKQLSYEAVRLRTQLDLGPSIPENS